MASYEKRWRARVTLEYVLRLPVHHTEVEKALVGIRNDLAGQTHRATDDIIITATDEELILSAVVSDGVHPQRPQLSMTRGHEAGTRDAAEPPPPPWPSRIGDVDQH